MSSTIPFDAYKGGEPFIFVSYAHTDRESVFPLIQVLHQQGYRIWYDEGIDPGNEWAVEIARALKNASQFLVFISPGSIKSKNVKNEINFALNRDKAFIAVHLVETQLPDELDLRMGDIQAILKWRMNDEHFCRKLSGSLSPDLKRAGVPAAGESKEAAHRSPSVLEPPKLRAPSGFHASEGTTAEPFSNSGFAQEVVHAATGMVFRFIPPGNFTMGSPAAEEGRFNDELQHRVTLTKGFWMGRSEVTQAQWEAVMGRNPSHFKGPDLPVESVSWDDCQLFIRKLNAKLEAGSTGGGTFRLPTEAEWEYACRAGNTGLHAGSLDQMAWYASNSGKETHPAAQKKPNAWGLYDMHGNVWEWCQDRYGDYPSCAVTDPLGAASSAGCVFRGGSWLVSPRFCRSAVRNWDASDFRSNILGLRLVRVPAQ